MDNFMTPDQYINNVGDMLTKRMAQPAENQVTVEPTSKIPRLIRYLRQRALMQPLELGVNTQVPIERLKVRPMEEQRTNITPPEGVPATTEVTPSEPEGYKTFISEQRKKYPFAGI